jgi:hypothetical protein
LLLAILLLQLFLGALADRPLLINVLAVLADAGLLLGDQLLLLLFRQATLGVLLLRLVALAILLVSLPG